jgi:hypothetical protein
MVQVARYPHSCPQGRKAKRRLMGRRWRDKCRCRPAHHIVRGEGSSKATMVELRGLEPLTSSMPWWPGRRKRRAARTCRRCHLHSAREPLSLSPCLEPPAVLITRPGFLACPPCRRGSASAWPLGKDADADALVDVGCGQAFSQADRGVLVTVYEMVRRSRVGQQPMRR